MATETELYKEILKNSGGNPDELPDNLRSTLLKAIAKNVGSGGTGGGFGPVVTYGDTLTWDGNTEGHLTVEIPGAGGTMFVKISDTVPTLDDCKNGVIESWSTGEAYTHPYEELAEYSMDGFFGTDGGAYFVLNDNFAIDEAFVFPKAGVYVPFREGAGFYISSLTIPGYAGFETTTYPKIPIESLPDGYPYSEVKEGVLLEETTVTAAEDGDMTINGVAPTIFVGNTYKVTWNGTEYTCVAWEAELEPGWVAPLLGNKALIGEADSGEPFVIIPYGVINKTVIFSIDGSTSATVGITGQVETIHQLDKKYYSLNYHIPTVLYEPFVKEEMEAAYNAFLNGYIVTANYYGGKGTVLAISFSPGTNEEGEQIYNVELTFSDHNDIYHFRYESNTDTKTIQKAVMEAVTGV